MNIETPSRMGAVSRKGFSKVSLLLSIAFAASAALGQGIPATPPTAAASSTVPVSSASASNAAPALPRYRAEVIADGSRLEVRANNSSLNSILRMLSQQTGLTISGGVVDQRVFGTYGPGPADQVLSELLENSGTNMILRQTPSGGLGELILSPRLGGPSPPSPSSLREEAEEMQMTSQPVAPPLQGLTVAQPAQQSQVPPPPSTRPVVPAAASPGVQPPVTPDPQGIREPPLASPAPYTGSNPGTTAQPSGASDNTSGRTTAAPADTTKTPQQIYEELQKLHQQ